MNNIEKKFREHMAILQENGMLTGKYQPVDMIQCCSNAEEVVRVLIIFQDGSVKNLNVSGWSLLQKNDGFILRFSTWNYRHSPATTYDLQFDPVTPETNNELIRTVRYTRWQ